MADSDRAVADWITEGLTTMALHCSCGHYATVKLADLPPALTRTRLGQNARCAKCGKRCAHVMRDMAVHYRQMRDESGFDPTPRPDKR